MDKTFYDVVIVGAARHHRRALFGPARYQVVIVEQDHFGGQSPSPTRWSTAPGAGPGHGAGPD